MATTLIITADGETSTPTTYLEADVDAVMALVATYLGGSPTNATTLAHTKAGYDSVLKGLDPRKKPPRRHFWTFLRPSTDITFSATSTGTASGQGSYSDPSTTLTATAVSFDESMLGHDLTFDASETAYAITAVTSTTVVVITGDASGEASGDTFSIDAKGFHDAPAAFRGLIEPPIYAYGASGNRYDLKEESPDNIRRRWRNQSSAGSTRWWALEPKTFDETVGQKWRFMVAPVPDEDMAAQMRMVLRVTDPASGNMFIGGDIISTAVRDAALADAELITGGVEGTWAGKAHASLIAAIDADTEIVTTRNQAEHLIIG